MVHRERQDSQKACAQSELILAEAQAAAGTK